jgi:hypothetical protein
MPQVRLQVEKYRAVLSLENDKGEVIDQEIWVFPSPMPKDDAKDMARDAFDEIYDTLNIQVHGTP